MGVGSGERERERERELLLAREVDLLLARGISTKADYDIIWSCYNIFQY